MISKIENDLVSVVIVGACSLWLVMQVFDPAVCRVLRLVVCSVSYYTIFVI